MNPFLMTDGYKTGHHLMYPENTTLVYSNFTPRSNKHAPKGIDQVVSFGQQAMMRFIVGVFEQGFFRNNVRKQLEAQINATAHDFRPFSKAEAIAANERGRRGMEMLKRSVCQEIQEEYSMYLGYDYDVSHIEALWDLGHLPIKVKALPEGTRVPMGVPVLTVVNTHKEFYWITNFLETLISNLLWKPMTSATIADQYKRNLVAWAEKTDKENVAFVDFQGHDFSMRGLDSPLATITSGLGHATSFLGSDSLPVISGARQFYDETEFVVGSVPATEHSVMCAGSKDDEIGTFRRLMKQFPTGILSVVSDTWNLWDVLTKILPELKDEIMAREGKIVIRPDSGDPVQIICGQNPEDWTRSGKDIPKQKGVVEMLWDLFGGTINDQGFKVLDPHIGVIYGDSITIDRAEEICQRLHDKGFASTNIVLGVGSFTYQFNTRDTFGFAMKATYVEIKKPCECDKQEPLACVEGDCVEEREIFKDPITDDGTKKSAKGLLMVGELGDGTYELHDQCDWSQEDKGALQVIFDDGKFANATTLTEIRRRLSN